MVRRTGPASYFHEQKLLETHWEQFVLLMITNVLRNTLEHTRTPPEGKETKGWKSMIQSPASGLEEMFFNGSAGKTAAMTQGSQDPGILELSCRGASIIHQKGGIKGNLRLLGKVQKQLTLMTACMRHL